MAFLVGPWLAVTCAHVVNVAAMAAHLRQDKLAHCASDVGQIGEQHFDAALNQPQQKTDAARQPI
jgi:hypothetical protein